MIPQAVSAARTTEAPAIDMADGARLRLHAPPPRPAGLIEPSSSGGMKFLNYVKYRWITVLFLGGALASTLAYAAWNLIPAKYTTTSMIQVSMWDQPIYARENPQGLGDFNTYLKTQADLLRSQFVLTAALRDPEVASLPMLREQVDPIQFLIDELKIETKDGSEIIKMSLSGEDPRGIARIVNAVQQAFFDEVVVGELKRKKERLRVLEDQIQKNQAEVKLKRKNLEQAEEGEKPATEIQQALNAQFAAGQVARLKEVVFGLEAEIKALMARRDASQQRIDHLSSELPTDAALVEAAENDPRVRELTGQLDKLQSRIDYFIQELGADPEHAAVKNLRQKAAETKEQRDALRKTKMTELSKGTTQSNLARIQQDLQDAKVALAGLTTRKEQTEKLIEEYQAIVDNPITAEDRPLNFPLVDIKERERITQGMIDKANLLRQEINAPARVREAQRAAVPLKKEMKKQLLGTIAAGLFGFALIGLCVVGYESRVQRALSLADVQKVTLGPVVGVVPGSASGQGVAAADSPAVAEALDKVRGMLLQQFDRPGSKLILVSSALRDEGKAFLAWQVAESFARTGTKTVIVDFDLRTPAIHSFMQLPNEAGFCEALTGQADAIALTQNLPSGLHLLPAGRWADTVRHYLVPERIGALLDYLRSRFDCVVLNSHPLLEVAETFVAARYADAVLLAVEKHESRLPLVARAQDKIAALSPESFGVVFLGASDDECLH
jgi:Mrp family chromosome partitioning ATPase/capsular polysaccharide biosynthesis protein